MSGSRDDPDLNSRDLDLLTVFDPYIRSKCHGGSEGCGHIVTGIRKHLFFSLRSIDLHSFLAPGICKTSGRKPYILCSHYMIEMSVGKEKSPYMKACAFNTPYYLFACIGSIKKNTIRCPFSVHKIAIGLNGTYDHSAYLNVTHLILLPHHWH